MIGHVSPSQRVLSIERSSSLIRTQGKRYGSRLTRLPRHYGAAATPLVSMISSENVAVALILRPGLYATRAKYHSYRDRAVDAVRSHLNALDIADFDTALLYTIWEWNNGQSSGQKPYVIVPSRFRPLDHLIRPPQHRRRDRQTERLRGLEIDGELELGGLLDR